MNDTKHVPQQVMTELLAIADELERADTEHGPNFASMHEAHSVLLEELEEFWEEVRKKRSERDEARMRYELTQLGAMAVKTMRQLRRPV